MLIYYYKREKSNIVGTFFNGEVNVLSASSNQIRDGKSKERKESSTVSSRRDPEKTYARSSQQYQKLRKQHRKLLMLLKSMIVTKNHLLQLLKYIINNTNLLGNILQ